jgi:hypothetical protein
MDNFASILDKQAETLEAPKPIPVGTYLCLIAGPEEYKEVGQNKTTFVGWPVKFMAPQEDVDSAALSEALLNKDGTSRTLGDVKMRHEMALTEASAFIVRDFLQQTLDIDPTGKTLRQMISEALGKQFLATVKHGITKGDNPRVYATIDKTAKV